MAAEATQLMTQALWLVLALSAPPIIVASAVGLLISIFQSATQLQDQTLQYAGKFIAIVLTIAITAQLLAGSLYAFGDRLFTDFPHLVRQ